MMNENVLAPCADATGASNSTATIAKASRLRNGFTSFVSRFGLGRPQSWIVVAGVVVLIELNDVDPTNHL